jgi:superfamily II DNA helicase RecQ
MAYKFITVPVHDPRAGEEELNAFLRSHRVLAVERKWIESGPNSCWVFCVDYLESSGGEPSGNRTGLVMTGGRARIDYREVLKPEDFAVFVRLRQWRQELAKTEAVPVYTIFTNEQLAKMAQLRASTRADLESIAGVGDARIEKYGARVLEVLKGAANQRASNGESV